MITLPGEKMESFRLSESEAKLARESSNGLADFANGDECLEVTFARDSGEQTAFKLPARTVHLFASLLGELAKGSSVTIIPEDAELTSHQAAAVMHVSRPYLIKLLDAGKIPFRKVGAHRRIRFNELKAFMEDERKARDQALDELTVEAQRLGLY